MGRQANAGHGREQDNGLGNNSWKSVLNIQSEHQLYGKWAKMANQVKCITRKVSETLGLDSYVENEMIKGRAERDTAMKRLKGQAERGLLPKSRSLESILTGLLPEARGIAVLRNTKK